ncbi:MAG: multidrug effflux MFS transporter [Roseibium sp.]
MSRGFVRSAIVLGLLAVVGPFAIDLYLPALPQIVSDLQTDDAAVQLTFSVYFAAFGLAQLIYGPLADRYGRRPPIFLGMAIYIIGSLMCTWAPDIGALTLGRFVQAIGAAAAMVVVRAVVRDLHTGTEATRLMALVMLVFSISPLLAPLAGSGIIAFGSWRLIFLVLGVIGVASAVMVFFQLPETLPPERRTNINGAAMLKSIVHLCKDLKFMGLTLISGFSLASFFVFIASAPLVYMTQYGLTPTEFSLVFALGAAGFFISSQFAAPLGERFGMAPVALTGVTGFAAATSALFLLVWSGFDHLSILMALLFVANSFLGQVIAPTMVMALEDHGEHAGMASSLGGTLQMLAGGVMIFICTPFFDRTALPMVGAIALCAISALILAVLTLKIAPKSNATV